MRRRERFGTYDKSFEDELDMVPLEQGITHLYNTRGIVDKWLGHPTLDSIFPGAPLDVEILHHVEYDGSFPTLQWKDMTESPLWLKDCLRCLICFRHDLVTNAVLEDVQASCTG